MNFTEWYSGVNDFRKCTYTPGNGQNQFVTEVLENDFEPNRDLETIVLEHLLNAGTNKREVLFSGGVDSEFVVNVCKKYKVDCEVIIMKLYVNGFLYNTHDMYYAEKFVRENDIKHRIINFDAVDFFSGGKYLEYAVPYNVDEPHVAAHFWLIEQCSDFPIFGGDWFWVHAHLNNKVLSPPKYKYSLYELFMKSRGITGMGNCLGHSFESNYRLMQLQINAYDQLMQENKGIIIEPTVKRLMYGLNEPRIKSHGWNTFLGSGYFTVDKFKEELSKYVTPTSATIKWGDQVSSLLNANVNENDTYA